MKSFLEDLSCQGMLVLLPCVSYLRNINYFVNTFVQVHNTNYYATLERKLK